MPYLLEARNLSTYFPVYGGLFRKVVNHVRAVDGVSFVLREHETLGVVGESGCGKSTLGRTVLYLNAPTAGKVVFEGQNMEDLSPLQLRKCRIHMQMIFQNPLSSLNPRQTVLELLSGAAKYHGLIGKDEALSFAIRLLELVGLSRTQLQRFPHEFSGGQRQRLCIASALALNPKLLVCDEAVSALDVSIQAQILNLFKDLQQQFGVAYMFISHDMGVIRYISDRVAVMYLGRIVETAEKESLFQRPKHPYTKALLDAIPASHPARRKRHQVLQGDVPSPTRVYPGCAFTKRCPDASERCRLELPELRELAPGHQSAATSPLNCCAPPVQRRTSNTARSTVRLPAFPAVSPALPRARTSRRGTCRKT